MTLKLSLFIILIIYTFSVWLSFYSYMDDKEHAGFVFLVLAIGGVIVASQMFILRPLIDWKFVLVTNLFVLIIIGVVVGTISENVVLYTGIGSIAGLTVSLIVFWLLELAMFRPRRKLFLSYRRGDSAYITGRLNDALVSRYGKNQVFMDVKSLMPGVDYKHELLEFERKCDAVLVVIGDQWLDAFDEAGNRRLEKQDDFVRIEIETSLKANVPVIPILLQDMKLPPVEQLPTSITELVAKQAVAIRPDPDFDHDIAQLIKTLEGVKAEQKESLDQKSGENSWFSTRIRMTGLFLFLLLTPLGWRYLDEVTRNIRSFEQAVMSADGKYIYTLNKGSEHKSILRKWSTSSGEVQDKASIIVADLLTISPDSRYLLISSYSKGMEIFDAKTLKHIYRKKGSFDISSAAWSPDSRYVAIVKYDYSTKDARIIVWGMYEKKIVAVSDQINSDLSILKWSANGDKIAVTDKYKLDYRKPALFDQQGNNLVPIKIKYDDAISYLAWSKNGERLAMARATDPNLLIYTFEAKSISPVILPYKSNANSLVWSPKLDQLTVFDNDAVTVWDTKSKKVKYEWAPKYGFGGPFQSGIWSSDEAFIAIVVGTSTSALFRYDKVLVWEPGKSEPKIKFKTNQGIEQILGWSSGNRSFVIHKKIRSLLGYDSSIVIYNNNKDETEHTLQIGVWEGLLQKLGVKS